MLSSPMPYPIRIVKVTDDRVECCHCFERRESVLKIVFSVRTIRRKVVFSIFYSFRFLILEKKREKSCYVQTAIKSAVSPSNNLREKKRLPDTIVSFTMKSKQKSNHAAVASTTMVKNRTDQRSQ